MANNRMYLRCKACGEIFFLGKRFGNGYYISQYEQYKGVPLMERLNKFYDDHEWCGDAGLDCFELIYEFPPKPVTNAERIRSMSDEDLARFLWQAAPYDNCPPIKCIEFETLSKPTTDDCIACWGRWLKQEAE